MRYLEADFNIQKSALEVPVFEQWQNEFQVFRDRKPLHCGACTKCDQWAACLGGSMHDRSEEMNLHRCAHKNVIAGSCLDISQK